MQSFIPFTELSNGGWFVLILAIMVMLYAGRKPAHNLLNTLGSSLYQSLRILSMRLNNMSKKLQLRNREVLLAHAQQESERRVGREFERLQQLIQRDLSNYPEVQQRLDSLINNIEQSYQESADNPPLPPAWGDIVKMVSDLPSHGDPAVTKVLKSIKDSVQATHKETLKAYQVNNAKRHKVLASMQPHWREIHSQLKEVDSTVDALDKRSHQLDLRLQELENIHKGEQSTLQSLTSSSLTQFFTSGLILAVALLGGLINFQLIALPMSEMVSSSSYIGAMKTSDIAALVIILIEVVMGVFVLESLQITRLFPLMSSLDDRMRKRMFVISLIILTVLACIEASLAYMRDLLALDREALNQSLAATASASTAIVAHAEFRWIPSIGQMIMGFILPFALAFIAIPLESFMQSLRTVLGLVASGLLQLSALILHLLGRTLRQSSQLLIQAYDFLIMLPVMVEKGIQQLWLQRQQRNPANAVDPIAVKPNKPAAKEADTSAEFNSNNSAVSA